MKIKRKERKVMDLTVYLCSTVNKNDIKLAKYLTELSALNTKINTT